MAQGCGVLWKDEALIDLRGQWFPHYYHENSDERKTVRSLSRCKCGVSVAPNDVYFPRTLGQFVWDNCAAELWEAFIDNCRTATRNENYSVCPWCSFQSEFVRTISNLYSKKDYFDSPLLKETTESLSAKEIEGYFLYGRYVDNIKAWISNIENERRKEEMKELEKQNNRRKPAGTVY